VANLDNRTLRIIIIADVAAGWLLLLGSIGLWFGLNLMQPALIIGGVAAAMGVAGRLLAATLIDQMPGTLDLNSASAFERYFAEQARKEQATQQNMSALLIGLAVVIVVFVVGNAMIVREVPGAEFALYAMWATGVFALVVYTLQLDDLFAAMPEGRAAPRQTDREEETPPPWL
jgi:hypothetical protein